MTVIRFETDRFAHLGSPVHRWQPVWKIGALLVLAFVTASLHETYFLLPPVILGAVLAWASRLPRAYLAQRLWLAHLGFAPFILVLPWTVPGPPVLELGPVAVTRTGLVLGLQIYLKALGSG